MTKGGRKGTSGLQQMDSEGFPEMKKRRSPKREWSDRRPLRFWQPFNDWWRKELERLGRRPNAEEILEWYNEHAYSLWNDDAPTLQETRIHAKCLRSLPLVRDYFRNYRAKKRSVGDRSGSFVTGDDLDYRDDDEDGDVDDAPHLRRGRRGGGRLGGDPDEDDPADDVDYDGFNGTDGGAAAAAAAGLTQLAHLRHGGSPPDSLPLDLLHPALSALPVLPALPSMLNPAAAALWNSASGVSHNPAAAAAAVAAAAGLDASQPAHDLLRSITLQQLQHAAAVQQQLALATIAQNLALSRAAGIGGFPGLSQQGLSQAQQNALIAAVLEGEQLEGHQRGGEEPVAGYRAGEGRPDSYGADDDVGDMDDPAASRLGRGKRKRLNAAAAEKRHEQRWVERDEDAELGDAAGEGSDMAEADAQPGPSGRGFAAAAAASGRRIGTPQQQQPAIPRQKRGPRGAVAAKQSATKRPPLPDDVAGTTVEDPEGLEGAVGSAAGPLGLGGDEGATPLLLPPPLQLLHVPAGLGLEPLPREVLQGLSREQLVERVLLLQAHLQLSTQQQPQGGGLLRTPVRERAQRTTSPVQQRAQPPEEREAAQQPPTAVTAGEALKVQAALALLSGLEGVRQPATGVPKEGRAPKIEALHEERQEGEGEPGEAGAEAAAASDSAATRPVKPVVVGQQEHESVDAGASGDNGSSVGAPGAVAEGEGDHCTPAGVAAK